MNIAKRIDVEDSGLHPALRSAVEAKLFPKTLREQKALYQHLVDGYIDEQKKLIGKTGGKEKTISIVCGTYQAGKSTFIPWAKERGIIHPHAVHAASETATKLLKKHMPQLSEMTQKEFSNYFQHITGEMSRYMLLRAREEGLPLVHQFAAAYKGTALDQIDDYAKSGYRIASYILISTKPEVAATRGGINEFNIRLAAYLSNSAYLESYTARPEVSRSLIFDNNEGFRLIAKKNAGEDWNIGDVEAFGRVQQVARENPTQQYVHLRDDSISVTKFLLEEAGRRSLEKEGDSQTGFPQPVQGAPLIKKEGVEGTVPSGVTGVKGSKVEKPQL